MKVFQIAALALSATTAAAAVKKVKATTECSHTTCEMINRTTAIGVHEVMKITHSNVESKCAGYQTIAKNNYVVDLQKKVHCGRVKRWVSDGGNAGHFSYDGPCECHVKGSHPNSAASQEVVTKPCAMVQCQTGWTLAGADERGCGGTCESQKLELLSANQKGTWSATGANTFRLGDAAHHRHAYRKTFIGSNSGGGLCAAPGSSHFEADVTMLSSTNSQVQSKGNSAAISIRADAAKGSLGYQCTISTNHGDNGITLTRDGKKLACPRIDQSYGVMNRYSTP